VLSEQAIVLPKMCRADGCCGGFVGVMVLVGCIFALGFPWYFRAYSFEGLDNECTLLYMTSWSQQFCMKSSQCPDELSVICGTMNWRDYCSDAETLLGTDVCQDVKTLFNVALALSCIASVLALGVIGGSLARCCSARYRDRLKWHVACSFGGLAFLIGAVIYFAAKEPQTIPTLACTDDIGSIFGLSCDKFWGSRTADYMGFTYTVVWGPAGWVAATVTLLFYALASCCSVQRAREGDVYHSLNNESQG